MDYRVKWTYDSRRFVKILDRKTKYCLNIGLSQSAPNFDEYSFVYTARGIYSCVTARNVSEYENNIRELMINPFFQYAEVGAGLGEFIPNLVDNYKIKHLPIIIDPVDYELMGNMLGYELNLKFSDRVNKNLLKLFERCKIIRDQNKVRLINEDLVTAIKSHLDIHNIADIVIDNFGATHYMTNYRQCLDYERKLLKPNGYLLLNNAN